MSFISRFNQILGKSVAFTAKDALRRERAQARERALPQASPGTWLHLGNEHYAAQRLAQAEACYREALRLSPELAGARNNLGLVLRTTGRYAEAIAAFGAALSAYPGHADALYNLGQTHALLKDGNQAEREFRLALSFDPALHDARLALGALLHNQGRREEAIAEYRQVAGQHPTTQAAWHNLCVALQEVGRHEKAIDVCREGLRHLPDSHRLHADLAYVLLVLGRFEEGWREYEWRLRGIETGPASSDRARWQGEALSGKTLLVHGEQGLGDVVMGARFLPLLRSYGGRVVLACPARALELLRHAHGMDRIVALDSPEHGEVPYDAWVPLLSVPGILGTTAATVPPPIRLDLPTALLAGWRSRLPDAPGIKVGLAWAGSPRHINDSQRSIDPERLAPLFAVPGAQFFKLQLGRHDPVLPFPMHDLTGHIRDYADTAALISHLDLVISVDTSVAHVAGTMATPTWVLLPFAPDWRWGLGREDSPWYPSMRLFRQARQGDWDEVMARVAAALLLRAGARGLSMPPC